VLVLCEQTVSTPSRRLLAVCPARGEDEASVYGYSVGKQSGCLIDCLVQSAWQTQCAHLAHRPVGPSCEYRQTHVGDRRVGRS